MINTNDSILCTIGDTLKCLLTGIPLPGDDHKELKTDDIVLGSPADIEDPKSQGITLFVFLYQIVENSYWGDQSAVSPESTIDPHILQFPPLIVDLAYLFVPTASSREIEYSIIEGILQRFYDRPVLLSPNIETQAKTADVDKEDLSYFRKRLANTKNDEIRIIRNPLGIEELNKLWSTFPGKSLKLSLSYLVTPVRIPSSRTITETRVTTKEISYQCLDTK